MKDLENFVDVVESVNSGGASLFGLRSAETGQDSTLDAGLHNRNHQYCIFLTEANISFSFMNTRNWWDRKQEHPPQPTNCFNPRRAGKKKKPSITLRHLSQYIHRSYYAISDPISGKNAKMNGCQLQNPLETLHTSNTHHHPIRLLVYFASEWNKTSRMHC